MEENKVDNPPAFPRPDWSPHEWSQAQEGMTLFDWYVGQAMCGLACQYSSDTGSIQNLVAHARNIALVAIEARQTTKE